MIPRKNIVYGIISGNTFPEWQNMYGNKIRMIRLSRGLSQEDMAKQMGIAQKSYSKMENNRQKIADEVLNKIAATLGVSAEDIKSPEPIILHISNSPYSGQNNNYNINEEILKSLAEQLKTKDEQINSLLQLIKSK